MNENNFINSPTFKEVFLDKIDINDNKYIWVGHNIVEDIKVIISDSLRYIDKNMIPNSIKVLCTQTLYKKLYTDNTSNKCNLLLVYKNLLGPEFEPKHNANQDVLICMKIFEKILEDNKIEKISKFIKEIKLETNYEINYKNYDYEHILRLLISEKIFKDLEKHGFVDDCVKKKTNDIIIELKYLKSLKKECEIEFIKNKYLNFTKTEIILYFQGLLSYFIIKNNLVDKDISYILICIEKKIRSIFLNLILKEKMNLFLVLYLMLMI